MTALNVVVFPGNDIGDIPGGLRRLASAIEAGEHGEVRNIAWVLHRDGDGISAGLLGPASEPAAIGYFLFGLGQRSLEP